MGHLLTTSLHAGPHGAHAGAAVLLQAALAAVFAPALLHIMGARGSLRGGMAAGATAGAVGAAALAAAGDPEAVPAGAVAHALVGVLSSLLVACEPVRAALQSLLL